MFMDLPKEGEEARVNGNYTGYANTSVVLNGASSQVEEDNSVSDN